MSLRQLLFSIPDALIGDIVSDRVLKARTEMPQEEVAQLMKRYDTNYNELECSSFKTVMSAAK